MSLDMVINILFVLFVGTCSASSWRATSGYVFANICAISAFILLRRDRPDWPRPIKLASYWVPIAYVLCGAFIVFEVVGVGWFQIAGGGPVRSDQEQDHRLLVLAISLLLFLFRRIVQDKERRTGARRRRRCPTSTSRSSSRRR
jgi:amino acid transporter